MKVAVIPASTRTTTAVIRSLLAQEPSVEVQAWYRDTSKAPAEFTSQPNFTTAKGDVLDSPSLDFSGCDVVVAVPPPFFANEDMFSITEKLSRNIKEAVERSSSVKRLVLLSSVGAHLSDGVGEVATKTVAEKVLKETNMPRISVIRPAFFMDNWSHQIPTLKGPEPSMTSYFPADDRIPMVAIKDVGSVAAREATTSDAQEKRVAVYEITGPVSEGYSATEIRDVFSKCLGKEVKLTLIEPSNLPGFFGGIVPPGCVDDMVNMVLCLLPDGVLAKNPDSDATILTGTTSLEDAMREIALQVK